MNKKINEYTLEIAIAFISILVSIILDINKQISPATALVIGMFSILLSISIAIIKEHISKVSNNSLLKLENNISKYISVTQHLSDLDGIAYKHAKSTMDKTISTIKDIKEGKIFLEQEEYYRYLTECMQTVPSGSKVIAINIIDSMRWSKEPTQIKYFDENKKASQRGVKIHRIFIIEEKSLEDKSRVDSIKQHIEEENIDVDIIFTKNLKGFTRPLEDMVLFNCEEGQRLYIDYSDNINRTNILYANLFICPEQINYSYETYKLLLGQTQKKEVLDKIFNAKKNKE